MRLIDVDNLIFDNVKPLNKTQMKAVLDFLDKQHTAYDVEKVIEQLDKKARGNWGYPSVMEFDDVIEIVKGGGLNDN